MKKIIILANSSSGLYSFRRELIAELRKQAEITLLVPHNNNFEKLIDELDCTIKITNVDRRGINPISDFFLFIKYCKCLKKEKPEYVITYTIKPNIYGGLACRLLKIPYAVNITGLGTAFQNQGILKKIVTTLYKFSLKKASVVFFENYENMQVFLKEKIVCKRQTCLLNGAGVNLERYSYIDYPIDEMPVRFLFIGRVMKEKGINELFKAMRTLRKHGVDCILDVLGGYEENYEPIIKKFEEEGWLHYHGYQEDVRPFIANCHCFVLPSWHEGMANTNLECAAMGRPVITSNIHGCKEAVVDGKSGILCEKKNAHSLYAAMKRFTELPIETKVEMGRLGRKHMEKHFDKRNVVEKTVNKLMEV